MKDPKIQAAATDNQGIYLNIKYEFLLLPLFIIHV